MASFNRLAASVDTMDFVPSFTIDEGHAAAVARIGYTDSVRMMGTFSFETLMATDLRLNGRISADGTECPLL